MLRVIFDTNIYGLLGIEPDVERIAKEIRNDSKFVIYEFPPVRKELRDIPREHKTSGSSTRVLLLSLHDRITKGKLLALTTEISTLAKVFFIEYNKLGGTQSWSAIETDFFIVACAALNDLNLIVSDDCRTLKSDKALEAYKNISVEKSIWIPHIWTYSDLKKKYNF